MMKRVVYPLFFLVLVLVIIIPSSTPLAHASLPQYDRSVETDCTNTPCTSAVVATAAGDTIMIDAPCYSSSANLGVVSDTLSTNFKIVNQLTIAQTGASSQTILSGTSSGGNDQVTVNCGSAFSPQFAFSVDIYSFVTGIGVTNKNFGSVASGTSSDTLTMIIQPNSFIYEGFTVSDANSACPTNSAGSGQSIRATLGCGAAGGNRINGLTLDKQFTNGGSTGSTASWTVGASSTIFLHLTVELLATGGSVTQVSNCYGNCGSPAVTSANTNSTKGINFNITQTYFYENQITFPALLVNMSARVACTYGTAQCPFAETLTLGLWATQTNCFGAVPFTSTCPAQLVSSAQIVNPQKGLFTFNTAFSVFTGQWIALGFTGSRSGLQLNDTNTAINIFNTSGFPATLSNTASQGTSKAEVYSWAVGNTVIGGGIIPSSSLCNQAVDFICTMNLAACGLTPSNCLIGAIILGLFWSIITIFALEIGLFKLQMTTGLPGGIYILIFVSWMSAWTISVGNLWFVILEILIVVYLFTSSVVGLASGTHRMGSGSSTA